MVKNAILAYDVGTSSVKATLFDEYGNTLASASQSYGTVHPRHGWAEQNPDNWWNGVIVATHELLEQPGAKDVKIASIGCSGHMMGALPVDKDGNPLYNSLIHSDSRAQTQYERIAFEIGVEKVYAMTGNILDSRSCLPKMLWFAENEPTIYAKTAKFLQSKDFIASRLTGNINTTDYSDASHGAMFDVCAKKYDASLYSTLGLSMDKLPEVHRSMDIVGTLREDAAAVLGLTAGIPVAAGAGDGICANIGSGISKPGDAYLCLGTTAWIARCADKPFLDEKRRVFSIQSADGESFGVFGTTQSACGALDWARNILGEQDLVVWNQQAAQIAPGCDGLVFLPYLDGERSPIFDTNARGVFFGMSASHTRAHFMRAVMEGVAYALRSIRDVMTEAEAFDKLRIIGGGARSELWCKIIADVLGCTLEIPRMQSSDVTSLGAAILAGKAVGMLRTVDGFGIIDSKQIVPDAAVSPSYDAAYGKYEKLYPALKDLF